MPVNLRITKVLNLWIDAEYEQRKASTPSKNKQALIAAILHEWEEMGDAMRYLRADGKIGWKATPRMLDRLADAERDAKDELDEWP
jgi:hypothetical protein